MQRNSSSEGSTEKIGRLLSSYYAGGAGAESEAAQSDMSVMSSLADFNSLTVNSLGRLSQLGSPERDPLQVSLTKWRTATAEEHKLKTEAKALLYENCDKFFACVGLIGRLDKDVSKVQSEQMTTIGQHTLNMTRHFKKNSAINEADPLRSAETQFLHALGTADLLGLPGNIQAARPVEAIQLYMQFLPFFEKFNKFPLIKSLFDKTNAAARASLARLVATLKNFNNHAVDDTGNFKWANFQTRLNDLVFVLQAAKHLVTSDKEEADVCGNIARLALLAEAQVAENALRDAADTAKPGIFLDEILNEIFERSREFSDKMEKFSSKFPGCLLDLVVPCIRESAVRVIDSAKFHGGTSEAEGFGRRVSYYFRFVKDVVDVDKFFLEACERWTSNCFATARTNFLTEDMKDTNADHLARLLQSRAIAAASESAKIYRKFEFEEEFPAFALGKIKWFIFACMCVGETQLSETELLVQLHRQADMRQTYLKIFTASLEEYLEPRQLEIAAKDISDQVKTFLYARFLKQWAEELARGDIVNLADKVDKIFASIEPNTKTSSGSKSAKATGAMKSTASPTLDIIQAERLLARRMEFGKTTEWRLFLLRHLFKTAVERKRAGQSVGVSLSSLSHLVDHSVGMLHEGQITLKAMLEDFKELEQSRESP